MATKEDLLKAFKFIKKDSGASWIRYAIDDHSYTCGLGDTPLKNMVQYLIPHRGDVKVIPYNNNLYYIQNGDVSGIYVVAEEGTKFDEQMEESMEDTEPYEIERLFNSMNGYRTTPKKFSYLEHAYRRMV